MSRKLLIEVDVPDGNGYLIASKILSGLASHFTYRSYDEMVASDGTFDYDGKPVGKWKVNDGVRRAPYIAICPRCFDEFNVDIDPGAEFAPVCERHGGDGV